MNFKEKRRNIFRKLEGDEIAVTYLWTNRTTFIAECKFLIELEVYKVHNFATHGIG